VGKSGTTIGQEGRNFWLNGKSSNIKMEEIQDGGKRGVGRLSLWGKLFKVRGGGGGGSYIKNNNELLNREDPPPKKKTGNTMCLKHSNNRLLLEEVILEGWSFGGPK